MVSRAGALRPLTMSRGCRVSRETLGNLFSYAQRKGPAPPALCASTAGGSAKPDPSDGAAWPRHPFSKSPLRLIHMTSL